VDRAERPTGHLLEFLHRPTILECEAFQSTAGNLTAALRHALARASAESLNAGGHSARCQELDCVRLYEWAKGGRLLGLCRDLIIAERLALQCPGTPAFLHQPQPHDVLEHAEGASHAAFIGKVVGQRLRGDDRFTCLDANQRPGARAEIHKVIAQCGHSGHGGTRVVCGGQDHGRAFQADLGGKAAFERAEDRAWLDDLRQNGRR